MCLHKVIVVIGAVTCVESLGPPAVAPTQDCCLCLYALLLSSAPHPQLGGASRHRAVEFLFLLLLLQLLLLTLNIHCLRFCPERSKQSLSPRSNLSLGY